MRRDVEVSPKDDAASVARTLRVIAIAAGIILLIWLLSDVVLLIFMAVVIAVILRGVSGWAARHTNLPQPAMLATVTAIAAILLVGFLYYLAPQLTAQVHDLTQQIQQQVEKLRQTYANTTWAQLLLQQSPSPQQIPGRLASYTRSIATSVVWSMATAFIVIVTAICFAASPELYVNGIVRLFPLGWRSRAKRLHYEIGRTLLWWSLGQSFDMLIVGVLTGAGMLLLQIPLALALAFIAAAFTFVPYFGALAASVPAVIVALNVSWRSALWVMIIFIGSHLMEGYVVAPFVQRRTVRLPPAVTILSMTVLGAIFGPLGVILGTPIAATLLVIVREVYVAGLLGDPEIDSEIAQ
jgi:predicted PurR-regulated permease PerM